MDGQQTWTLAAVEAALATVREAQQRVSSVLARADAVAEETAWQAQAAAAYRRDNARWRDGLRRVGAALVEREHDLRILRARLAAGG